MAFNPVQYGDWSTRLRRALGLRGDLGFSLAGPAAQPVVLLDDVHDVAFRDDPVLWAATLNIASGGAGTFNSAEVVLNSTQGFIVVDHVATMNTNNNVVLLPARGVAPTAGFTSITAWKTNFSPLDTAPAGGHVTVPVLVYTGSNAISFTSFAAETIGLYEWSRIPYRLWPGDKLVIGNPTAASALNFTVTGRYYRTAQ